MQAAPTRTDFQDPRITGASLAEATLVMLIGQDAVQYMFRSPTGDALVLKTHTNERQLEQHEFLDSIFNSDEMLKRKRSKAEIVFQLPRWALVPDSLMKTGDEARHLQASQPLKTSDAVRSTLVEGLGVRVVYALAESLNKRLDYYLKAYSARHVVQTCITEAWRLHQVLKADRSANLAFLPGWVVLTVLDGQKLRLANAFAVSQPVDVLYYLLSSLQALGLKPAQLKLTVIGNSTLQAGTQPLLTPHFPTSVDLKAYYTQQPLLTQAGITTEGYFYLLP